MKTTLNSFVSSFLESPFGRKTAISLAGAGIVVGSLSSCDNAKGPVGDDFSRDPFPTSESTRPVNKTGFGIDTVSIAPMTADGMGTAQKTFKVGDMIVARVSASADASGFDRMSAGKEESLFRLKLFRMDAVTLYAGDLVVATQSLAISRPGGVHARQAAQAEIEREGRYEFEVLTDSTTIDKPGRYRLVVVDANNQPIPVKGAAGGVLEFSVVR